MANVLTIDRLVTSFFRGLVVYDVRAVNWWNMSRMCGSRSWVKRRVSKVLLYFCTCSWCCNKERLVNKTLVNKLSGWYCHYCFFTRLSTTTSIVHTYLVEYIYIVNTIPVIKRLLWYRTVVEIIQRIALLYELARIIISCISKLIYFMKNHCVIRKK